MSPCLPQDRLRIADTSDRHIFTLLTAELHLFWMMTIARNLTRGQLLSGPRQEQSKSLLFTSYQLGFVSHACRLSLDGIIQYKICVSVTGASGECRPPYPVTWHDAALQQKTHIYSQPRLTDWPWRFRVIMLCCNIIPRALSHIQTRRSQVTCRTLHSQY